MKEKESIKKKVSILSAGAVLVALFLATVFSQKNKELVFWEKISLFSQSDEVEPKKFFQEIADPRKTEIGDLSDCDQISGFVSNPGNHPIEMKNKNGKNLHCFYNSDVLLSEVDDIRFVFSGEGGKISDEEKSFFNSALAAEGKLRKESGEVESDKCQGGEFYPDCPGLVCTSGSFYKEVKFSKKFNEVPHVIASPSNISSNMGTSQCPIGGATDYVHVEVVDVTKDGFKLYCSGSINDRARALPTNSGTTKGVCSWLALGE